MFIDNQARPYVQQTPQRLSDYIEEYFLRGLRMRSLTMLCIVVRQLLRHPFLSKPAYGPGVCKQVHVIACQLCEWALETSIQRM
jgi:hypothetical protein